MILKRTALFEAQANGHLTCEPWEPKNVQPNSIDLRLGNKLMQQCPNSGSYIDPDKPGEAIEVPLRDGKWHLTPNGLYLGHTLEVVGSDIYIPVIETRSSAARFGISAHRDAGISESGFFGQFVLEITVTNLTILRPGDRICQILFHTGTGEGTYTGDYNGQRGVRLSKGLK